MKNLKSPLENLRNPKRTQAVLGDLILLDLIDKEVIDSLKLKLSKFGDVVVSSIQLFLVPNKKDNQNKGQRVESLFFEQPSPLHFKNKKVIITTSLSEILDELLKSK